MQDLGANTEAVLRSTVCYVFFLKDSPCVAFFVYFLFCWIVFWISEKKFESLQIYNRQVLLDLYRLCYPQYRLTSTGFQLHLPGWKHHRCWSKHGSAVSETESLFGSLSCGSPGQLWIGPSQLLVLSLMSITNTPNNCGVIEKWSTVPCGAPLLLTTFSETQSFSLTNCGLLGR